MRTGRLCHACSTHRPEALCHSSDPNPEYANKSVGYKGVDKQTNLLMILNVRRMKHDVGTRDPLMNYAAISDRAITRGFFLAGAVNVIGMLAVSKIFTNSLLNTTDPAVFSWLGQVAVVLWGLAYWSVARTYRHTPYLVVVFFVEKMVYAVTWLLWLLHKGHLLTSIASESLMTANFFGVYGAGDFAFGIFFGCVALKLLREGHNSTA